MVRLALQQLPLAQGLMGTSHLDLGGTQALSSLSALAHDRDPELREVVLRPFRTVTAR